MNEEATLTFTRVADAATTGEFRPFCSFLACMRMSLYLAKMGGMSIWRAAVWFWREWKAADHVRIPVKRANKDHH